MEFQSFTVQDHSNFINSPISIRDVDRKNAMLKPSSNSIQYRAQHGHPPGCTMELLRDNLLLLPQEPQNWSLDNQFLSRKCMEMFGEQPLLTNQQAEPDSYWVRFPDNSILRRTRSMIKPRSLPSHFELQAEA